MSENKELELAFEFVQDTGRHIFLTGKAGTGKTTFLHTLRERSPKRMVVVAPTGVAAINAGGVTIHSFFQLPFGPILPGRLSGEKQNGEAKAVIHKFSRKKIDIIRSIDLLVIDEVSMVRADLLDGIDQVLRRFRNRNQVFGGVQMLMIGDLQQLPPVVKQDEWDLLRTHYESMFFFGSHAFRQCNPVTIELKHIYRQQDEDFIRILNEIRDDRLTKDSTEELNKRYMPGFRPDAGDGYIILTTHNAIANKINNEELRKLNRPARTFEAEVWGNFPEYSFPADPKLALKEGARVMFIRNDRSPDKRFFNGKTGTVTAIEDEEIFVRCDDGSEPIAVERELWENVKYTIDEKTLQIGEEVAGTFYQYPLRLAWAITIHKSQGLTFDRAVIDAQAAFAHGQTYVALSRCRTLGGLVLSTPISAGGIIQDGTVLSFNKKVEDNSPDKQVLNESKRFFLLSLLEELFSFRQISYQLDKIISVAEANRNVLLGNIEEKARTMNAKGARVLDDIGNKFMAQLRKLAAPEVDAESDRRFNERLGKARAYFMERIAEGLETPLESSSFDTDNRAVKKELDDRMQKLREYLGVKKACLESLKGGFVLGPFLNARALASVQDYSRKSQSRKDEEKTTVDHPVLFSRLRDWRSGKANQLGLPHYRVVNQQALAGIANSLPSGLKQLKEVKGIGPKKVKEYGTELIAMVEEYCLENNIPFEAMPGETWEEKPKKEKKHTREITLDLYREGKSVEEIAAERGLHLQTIEGHLSHYVASGQLDVSSFVTGPVLERIMDYFRSHPDARLAEAKGAIGMELSWGELRMGKAYYDHTG